MNKPYNLPDLGNIVNGSQSRYLRTNTLYITDDYYSKKKLNKLIPKGVTLLLNLR
jgi:hypothetical protein